MVRFPVVWLAWLAIFITPSIVWAATYVVSNDFATTDCQNFQCPNMLTALRSVNSFDIISVSPGTYTGASNIGLSPQTVGNSNLDFAYNFTHVSIIGQGDPSTVIFQGGLYDKRFLDVLDNSFSSISNITLENFNLPSLVSAYDNVPLLININVIGGAMTIANTTMSIEYVNFRNNSAIFGGGISAFASILTVRYCNFYDNTALYHGGGLSVGQTDLTLTDSVFHNNVATAENQQIAATGGAVYTIGVTTNNTLIDRCRFLNNTADHNGGAISMEPGNSRAAQGYVGIKRSMFQYNMATGVGSCLSTTSCVTAGGAVYVTAANVSIEDCTFEGNHAMTTSTIDVSAGCKWCSCLVGRLNCLSFFL